jgi:hypothetical protein
MLSPAIDVTGCEIRAVIRLLHDKNASTTNIHRELCAVYGRNEMCEATLRQWYRMFRDGRTNVHNEDRRFGHLVRSVDGKICER